MIILGIDTATKWTNVSISENGNLLSAKSELLGRKQSDLLPEIVNEILQMSNKKINDVDFFALATGPGYYTGIRTGMAFTLALAETAGKRVIPLSSLRLMANDLIDKYTSVAAVIKARFDSVYAVIYKKSDDNTVLELLKESYIKVAEFAEILSKSEKTVLTGPDALLYDSLKNLSNKFIEREHADAGQISLLAEKECSRAVLPYMVKANYLREPDIGPTKE